MPPASQSPGACRAQVLLLPEDHATAAPEPPLMLRVSEMPWGLPKERPTQRKVCSWFLCLRECQTEQGKFSPHFVPVIKSPELQTSSAGPSASPLCPLLSFPVWPVRCPSCRRGRDARLCRDVVPFAGESAGSCVTPGLGPWALSLSSPLCTGRTMVSQVRMGDMVWVPQCPLQSRCSGFPELT